MKDAAVRVFGWALVCGSAVAVTLAAAPAGPWATLAVAGVLVAASAWLAFTIARRYVKPFDELAASLGPRATAQTASAAELAEFLAAEQKKAAQKLEAAAATGRRPEAALAHTADAIVIVDDDGLVEYTNPTARFFLQDRVVDVTRRLSQPDLDGLVRRARSTGEAVAEEVTLRVPGAKPAGARAIPLAEGGVVLLLSDLSESYRLDQVRRDFVANVSHELKTPVAAIRALAETAATALNSDDLQTATRFVERLGTEATRFSDLVSDLLDLSRVEVGGEPQMSGVELDPLLSEAADHARAVAEVKGIDLELETSHLAAHADPSQLTMAVKNLVDNAVRYSERGEVKLQAYPDHHWVVISVSDQGIGIPADELGRIFERFYRVDKARSRATGGTGLGLAIVRHVAENHGGRVEVQSELGVGSKFLLYIPAAHRNETRSSEGSAA